PVVAVAEPDVAVAPAALAGAALAAPAAVVAPTAVAAPVPYLAHASVYSHAFPYAVYANYYPRTAIRNIVKAYQKETGHSSDTTLVQDHFPAPAQFIPVGHVVSEPVVAVAPAAARQKAAAKKTVRAQ
ncbi:hypothetical protein OESDEN_04471, partial [Oesophagostomum dentatum]